MNIQQSHSPAGLTINLRRPSFDLEATLTRDWHGDSAFRTAFFNAMSMLFPLGEKFFIDSVRAFRNDIKDDVLLAEITAFQGQEAIHRLKHQEYNELLCRVRGYDLAEFEKPALKRLAWVRENMSAKRQLAGTVASEHITAIMADDMLRRGDSLVGADDAIADLWRWHGVEETEHKAVAFDVYMAVCGSTKIRRRAMLMSTFFFYKDTFRNMCIMLKHDGKLWNFREWASGLNFLFGKPGILRRIFPAYLSFFKKDFHPWQDDNRYLVKAWEERSNRTVSP
jgi:predicted metal-dependent hydrolase